MKNEPAVVVLAAGAGSRYHGTRHKLSEKLGGETVLVRTLRNAVASGMSVVLVVSESLVAEALDQQPIAFAQYRGRRGSPVGFAAELFSELMMLKGDEGARRLLARYPTAAVELDDAGVLFDIDTVDDLAVAQRRIDGSSTVAL